MGSRRGGCAMRGGVTPIWTTECLRCGAMVQLIGKRVGPITDGLDLRIVGG